MIDSATDTARPAAAGAQLVRERIRESLAVKEALLADEAVATMTAIADAMTAALRADGKVLFFGNGGSAADAMHLAAELVGRFVLDRPPLPALGLADSNSSVTAIGNDFSFEDVFARQVQAFGRPGDVAVGISTSGTSENVLRGLRAAREGGLVAVGLAGERGAAMAAEADLCLLVPATATARVQEGYMTAAHAICELVERDLFG
jgi:D-sedoheptulose 7-phosphate isomerase